MQKLHGPHKSLPANPLLADPMYWNGYIEKVGTGTEDIINKCREYGLKTPEFYLEEDFRVVIWRAYNEGSVPMMIQGRSKGVPTRSNGRRKTIRSNKRNSVNFKSRTF